MDKVNRNATRRTPRLSPRWCVALWSFVALGVAIDTGCTVTKDNYDGYRRPITAGPVTAHFFPRTDKTDTLAAYLRTTGMGRAIFAEAAPELIDEALARAAAAVAPHAGSDGIELDGAAWLVTATA